MFEMRGQIIEQINEESSEKEVSQIANSEDVKLNIKMEENKINDETSALPKDYNNPQYNPFNGHFG